MRNHHSLVNSKIYYARVDFNWQIHWMTFYGVFCWFGHRHPTPKISAAKEEILTIKMLSRLVPKLHQAAEAHGVYETLKTPSDLVLVNCISTAGKLLQTHKSILVL